MPIKLKTGQVAVKDPSTGEYTGVDVLAEQTKAGLVEEIEQAGATQKAAVNSAGEAKLTAINTAGSDAVQDIEDKGEEVLNSIPSDYTELSGDVVDLKSSVTQDVTVSGTTPTITALDNYRYKCGEVATLTVTLPASGIVDVVFESGTTPTVLTITPPTGQTVKWANGFDPDNLEAETTYELNICDSLGVAASWT